MRIAIEEVIAVKETYTKHYEEVHAFLMERQGNIAYIAEDRHFQGMYAESVKVKLYETGVENIDRYVANVYEFILRLEEYILDFHEEVDASETARLDTDYFEALYEQYEAELKECKRTYRELMELEDMFHMREHVGYTSWPHLAKEIEILEEFLEFLDTLLHRFHQFERRHIDFFDDLNDGSFYRSAAERNSDMGYMHMTADGTDQEQMNKETMIRTLMSTYGFDEATTEIMFELGESIKKKHPEYTPQEYTHEYFRILASMVYIGKTWAYTAGCEETKSDLYEKLELYGCSKEEIKTLEEGIRLQHQATKNEGFTNDFAHEAVILAELNCKNSTGHGVAETGNTQVTLEPIIVGGKVFNIPLSGIVQRTPYIDAETSFKGDFDSESIDQVDMRSNIDAWNVNRDMQYTTQNPLITLAQYESDVAQGKRSRSEEYYRYFGSTPEEAKEEIKRQLRALTPGSIYIYIKNKKIPLHDFEERVEELFTYIEEA